MQGADAPKMVVGLAWVLGSEEPADVVGNRAIGPPDLDVARLAEAARPHGLLPLLYGRLSAADSQAVPAPVVDGLRRQFEANARRNLHLTAELLRLLRAFEERGIVAVPFKGPLLAQTAYGSIASRQFNDLDIVVREDDVRPAQALLVSEGYSLDGDLTGPGADTALRSHHQRAFYDRARRVVVELHWQILPAYFSFHPDPREMWDRLQDVSLGGMRVRTFAPEDLLLILCAHGAKHCWERFAWIADVAALIRANPSVDWRRILGESRRLGGERMLFLGLVLAEELGGAPIPDAVARLARADALAVALAAEVRQRLVRAPWGPRGTLEAFRFHLRARERFADRARYIVRLALTPTGGDYAWLPLPAAVSFLYSGLRPFRLAGGIRSDRSCAGV